LFVIKVYGTSICVDASLVIHKIYHDKHIYNSIMVLYQGHSEAGENVSSYLR
ncbi:hypothetical protein COCVIDRAFT_112741, partial [Bipolaris victoriae FI3]